MKILLFLPKKRKNLPLRGKFDRPRAENLQGAQFFRNYAFLSVFMGRTLGLHRSFGPI